MKVGEATRLYQAALEEQRIVRARADTTTDEGCEALYYIGDEVQRAREEMEFAHVTGT